MAYVEVSGLRYAYGGGRDNVFNGFSLSLEKGQTAGLLGPSGSGKSTLLRLLAGLDAPLDGRIAIGGTLMAGGSVFVQPERRGVGLVFQDYALFPHMTVGQNVAFGLRGMSRPERRKVVGEMLGMVRLEDFAKRYPHELSGGQQQRAAFARALAPRPRLLLLDEPFSNLDADLKASIRRELKQLLRQTGITSILVTHDREDAEAICDTIIMMPSGDKRETVSAPEPAVVRL
ncbi:ABC transporter [Paenibacillus oryzae]|uniref:ABC transporter n=1 Tax=Paenibacillus oryzae TaxID=1844972 RepID=A0A1A5YLW6_9BACL|nr:ABC transporter ATP-binding protein [Paenibacillus oryzae]OBR66380.1 ABC transporter [Paenibacillus oryzae]